MVLAVEVHDSEGAEVFSVHYRERLGGLRRTGGEVVRKDRRAG